MKTTYELKGMNIFSLMMGGFLIGGSTVLIFTAGRNIDMLIAPTLVLLSAILTLIGNIIKIKTPNKSSELTSQLPSEVSEK